MKQVLQNLKNGTTYLADVPCPNVGTGQLLIRTVRSLISSGTERMMVDFGKANPIGKARQQPDKVRMVLDKIKTDGFLPTLEAVRSKLEQPLPPGYCNAGEVLAVGKGVVGFAVGDRVASNGKHAEIVSVPMNLCAKLPDTVSFDTAAFTGIAAIALQGIRLVQPTLGERVVVMGLGLIGQFTVQLLRAQGCQVLAMDFDASKLALAQSFGAEIVNLATGEDPVGAAEQYSRGQGMDAVIIAVATDSNEPMHQAAQMCRKRGRIVLVGVTGLALSRDDFFKKELTFQVSCSFGPGRYDPLYEEKGQDYPIGYVRWTEQRNFEAVLQLMAEGKLATESLISHRFSLEQTEQAYAVVAGSEPSLGILLTYSSQETQDNESLQINRLQIQLPVLSRSNQAQNTAPAVAFIGSGNYATAVLIPAFKATGAKLAAVACSTGVSGVHAAKKFAIAEVTTDTAQLFTNANLDAFVITTRHQSHAQWVLQALTVAKPVFVEKPLCLTLAELADIEATYHHLSAQAKAPIVMVGFNRRFAPHVQKMKALLGAVSGAKSFVMTVNAGAIPADHWTQDKEIGGGRIIGEACHFIDLLRFLADSPIVTYSRSAMTSTTHDTVSLQLGFAEGSIGTIHYFANGCKAFPKERLEIFAAGRILQLDNFRKLSGFGWPKFNTMNLWRQDKGQKACAAAFVKAVTEGGPAPIPFAEIVEVSRISIELAAD